MVTEKVAAAAVEIRNFSVWYGSLWAVRNVSFQIPAHSVTAIIGPSGCGKSTLLRAINRMNEFIPGVRTDGELIFQGRNIYSQDIDAVTLRRQVGMVFQKPNPFPKSIFRNISWGLVVNGLKDNLQGRVETALRQAALWEEVRGSLHQSGLTLSGGQQQRLCIARAIAMEPEVLLMDEPCSALDPISTARIEDLLLDLKKKYTIVIVTHNMQQAARISDQTAFLYQGELVEFGATDVMFTRPKTKRTEDYITGKFG